MDRSSGLLGGYNSLLDPHLAAYFNNRRKKKELEKAGLITKSGELVSEQAYHARKARQAQKEYLQEKLSQAIIDQTTEMERLRKAAILQKLDEIAKVENVQRVKSERTSNCWHADSLPILLTNRASSAMTLSRTSSTACHRDHCRSVSCRTNASHHGDRKQYPTFRSTSSEQTENSDRLFVYSSNKASKRRLKKLELEDSRLHCSPYTEVPTLSLYDSTAALPPRPHDKQHVRRKKNAKKNHKKSSSAVRDLCKITMHYFGGTMGNTQSSTEENQQCGDEIIVEQQPSGANTRVVFRQRLQAGSDFSFYSKRHKEYPFSLTLYVNGYVYCRVSTCCEYKHQPGSKLGIKQAYFGVVKVEGSKPCEKCAFRDQHPVKKQNKRKGNKKVKEINSTTYEQDWESSSNVSNRSGSRKTDPIITEKGKSTEAVTERSEDNQYGEDFDSDSSTRSHSSHGSGSSSSSSSTTTSNASSKSTSSRKSQLTLNGRSSSKTGQFEATKTTDGKPSMSHSVGEDTNNKHEQSYSINEHPTMKNSDPLTNKQASDVRKDHNISDKESTTESSDNDKPEKEEQDSW